jgi:hypothetical protein
MGGLDDFQWQAVEVVLGKAKDAFDLMAALFRVLGIDPKVQYTDPGGRPTPMLQDGKAIKELF